jgi:nickel-dependent lactate racemase
MIPPMKSGIERTVRSVDTTGWPAVALEFGADALEIRIPPASEILTMKDVVPLGDPGEAFAAALAGPIGSPDLGDILRSKGKPLAGLTVAVSVSDITRPVPYTGEAGLLAPLLRMIESAGVPRANVTIVVGTGMHRPSTAAEKAAMFGDDIVRSVRILDHDCEDLESLVHIGATRSGTEVRVNGVFHRADVRIVTGLVESHFMAGVSGGRKGVCPALVDKRTLEKFHSPEFLESPFADNLILEGNPCHAEALEVARTVGVDFLVNVTLDKNMRLTGVFAGDLEAAHRVAFRFMRGYTAIPLAGEYDIVLTHGGYSGRNHYQSAKAGCSAVPAVKQGGTIILAADNRDLEPVGSPEYRHLLGRLKDLGGLDGYLGMLRDPSWTFTKDQWEPEMWGRVLRKVGAAGLIYCGPQIPAADDALLPGRSGREFLPSPPGPLSDRDAAREMVQNALLAAVGTSRAKGREPSVAFQREGPYGIPVFAHS